MFRTTFYLNRAGSNIHRFGDISNIRKYFRNPSRTILGDTVSRI